MSPPPPERFEPAIPASERLQTHVLDRAGTGIDRYYTVHYDEMHGLRFQFNSLQVMGLG